MSYEYKFIFINWNIITRIKLSIFNAHEGFIKHTLTDLHLFPSFLLERPVIGQQGSKPEFPFLFFQIWFLPLFILSQVPVHIPPASISHMLWLEAWTTKFSDEFQFLRSPSWHLMALFIKNISKYVSGDLAWGQLYALACYFVFAIHLPCKWGNSGNIFVHFSTRIREYHRVVNLQTVEFCVPNFKSLGGPVYTCQLLLGTLFWC